MGETVDISLWDSDEMENNCLTYTECMPSPQCNELKRYYKKLSNCQVNFKHYEEFVFWSRLNFKEITI